MLLWQCCKHVVDSVLKRGGTPILLALLTAKNWSAASTIRINGDIVQFRISSYFSSLSAAQATTAVDRSAATAEASAEASASAMELRSSISRRWLQQQQQQQNSSIEIHNPDWQHISVPDQQHATTFWIDHFNTSSSNTSSGWTSSNSNSSKAVGVARSELLASNQQWSWRVRSTV